MEKRMRDDYRRRTGKESFYTHVYMYIVDDTKVTLYADWGDSLKMVS